MLTTTISDFRTNVKKYLDQVSKNFETLIIEKDIMIFISWNHIINKTI